MLDAKIEKSRVAAIYRKIAPSYDLWAWLTESRARDRCLELADIQDGESVLEVAVGTGLAFEQIRREYLSQLTFPSEIICAKTGGSQ